MPKRTCKAHRTDGSPCDGYAMHGQEVCWVHGGAAPQSKRAAEQRIATRKAEEAISGIADAPPLESIGDVYDWLLQIAGTVKVWGEILQARVAKLHTLGYETEYAGTQLRADVVLFERALDRSAKLGEALVRLDLEGRKQALDERVAGQLVTVLRLVLGDLDLTDDQRMVAELVVPKRMKEMTG